MTGGRILFIKPAFKEGDIVTCRHWPAERREIVREVIEDGLAKFYRTSGGGTWGEGALTKVGEEPARSEPLS